MELSFHLGALLLTYAMHSTLLIGGVWLIIRLVKPRSPELREMLWKTALLGGVLTALASWLLPLPHWGNVLRLALPGAFEHVLEALPESGAVLNESGIIVTTEERPDALAQTAVADTGFDWTGAAQAALPWLFWCWLGLSAAGFFRLACAWRRLLLLQQQGVLVSDGDLPRATRRLLRGFGLDRQVEIWMVPGLQGPMVAGLRRWRLFLPEGFFSRLNEAEREAVLAHELAHLARGDGWWLLAGRVISCLFSIQPLSVVSCGHLRAEAE